MGIDWKEYNICQGFTWATITLLLEETLSSSDFTMHYSFDFAQQVHYPSSPLQPGLM